MQIADRSRKSINPGGLHKSAGAFRRTEGFLNFFIINLFIMNVGAAAKVMRFTFYQCTCEFGVFHHFFSSVNNILIGSVVFCLAYINVNELKPGIYAFFSIFYGWRVIQVYINLNSVLGFKIVHHVADVIQADIIYLALTDLHKYRRLFFDNGLNYRSQSWFII